MEHTAKFFVGQIVHHKKFDYRGVAFDVATISLRLHSTKGW